MRKWSSPSRLCHDPDDCPFCPHGRWSRRIGCLVAFAVSVAGWWLLWLTGRTLWGWIAR